MNLCKEDGCPRQCHTRGWCKMHYNRVLKRGVADPDALVAEVLDWILDGEPLTTPGERALHDPRRRLNFNPT